MSQVLAMANRIKELERMLEERTETTADHTQQTDLPKQANIQSTSSHMSSPNHSPTMDAQISRYLSEEDNTTQQLREPEYNTTSAIEDLTRPTESSLMDEGGTFPAEEPVEHSPRMSVEQLEYWQNEAISKCASLIQLSPETVSHLLQTHWAWVHPTFMFVSKSMFLRGAAGGGTFFSELLLCTLCLHSTRFTNRNVADDLYPRARLLLARTLHEKPSISTTQALLQLSAREIGQGARSAAWLYSGMAFRMMSDMGLFSAQKLASLSKLERTISKQLAWSCYLWDKAMSLYLGRAPVLIHTPDFDPPTGEDLSEDTPWNPYFGDSTKAIQTEVPLYCHEFACFSNFCKLATIINEILLTLYAKRVPSNVSDFVHQTNQRLDDWRAQSPEYLVFEPQPGKQCPPPNILTQK